MTPLLPELAGLEDAEQIFEALGVPYDPRVLAPYRLHVLRRFGLCVEAFLAERPLASESERRAALRQALRDSHETFTRSTPRDEKLFRALGGGRPVRIGRR
ncbi:MAG TPA: nitrogenase-stabilizing/protective protein NifW [Anaeromyxobacter sp.]